MLTSPMGTQIRIRALVDQGSEASFVKESIVQLLQLRKHRENIPLTGMGASSTGTARATVNLSLRSISDPSFHLETKALVLPRLTLKLPPQLSSDLDLSEFGDLCLSDPHFYKPKSVDVVLGSDVYCRILRPGLRHFPSSPLIAQDTALGWIVSGSTQTVMPRRADPPPRASLTAGHCVHDNSLQEALQRFWTVEELSNISPTMKPEDEACERLFLDTHFRAPDGRYIIRLPLRSEPPMVSAETRRMALGSLSTTHRRFARDNRMADSYREFMRVYEKLGHMERVPDSQIGNSRAWYIPHHAVIQSSPNQLKLRVVFDASRRTAEQHCLNDFLIPGPALQGDISLILLNWCRYRFVFTADIIKMFRQIRVRAEDQDLQRILWAPDPTDPPVDYRLTTVTYGTACAPYLAMRTLAQLAKDEQQRFPLGACCLQRNTYVDDIFAGAHRLDIAIQKRDELSAILRCAGIELDKWAANHSDLLPGRSRHSEPERTKQIASNEPVKTLGLRWNPSMDVFGFSVHNLSQAASTQTKRTVLSNIARVFDPLGWLAPVTITAKILMQDLWILKCDWDSPLPSEILERWTDYSNSMASISTLPIDRWLGTSPDARCQLHGFSDASSRAYAAVVYLRIQLDDGQHRVSLLMAKTKVSPVKTLSIPNLELSAAALLVRLVCHIQKLPFFRDLPVFAWSDSQVVLAWLRKHPCYWKTFVANRVSFIQTELPSAEWRHVSSKENPADLATRGVRPNELKDIEKWWHGPQWLSLPAEDWPDRPDALRILHVREPNPELELLARFSTLTRLIRIVAYCRRPLVNLRRRRKGEMPNLLFLTSLEISDARAAIIRVAQASAFRAELVLLTTNGSLPKRNPIRKLNPFVDATDGLLRVGGRLSHSALSRESKHPPILPHRSNLSRLFVHHAHVSSLHGGPTLTLSTSLQYVWILGRTRLVKTEIRNCIICQRVKPRLASQLMGDLPADRVTPARPFTSSGLDYAGPIQIRTTKGRGHRSYKGYIVLFVCFATHAVHLEVVSDLTTATFLAAYRRFVGRRGNCRHLYSDNGTTFQGAARELKRMFDASSEFYKEVATILANDGTDWTFIPPNSPHCGGLWEAGVKSTKHHLKRVIGEHTLTFEELSTLLVEIEACLNSRPLCPLTNELDDLSVLTPAHFLIGNNMSLLPDAEVPEVSENRLNRFQLLQRIRDNFWKRWSLEYLQHLQERSKWRSPSENFAVGQFVLVKDERYPPSKWPLGRVVEVYPGPDNLVRVATVKTATNTLRRHIAKLCPLSLPSPNAATS